MRRLSLSLVMLLVLSPLTVLDVRHVSASSPPPDSVRYCDSVYYVNGWSYSGTHEDTHSENSVYHTSKGDHTSEVPQSVLSEGGGGYLLNVRYKFTTGGLVKNQISKIEVEALARTDYSSEQYGVWLDIYNYLTATWDNAGFFYGNTENQTINWTDATVAADHSPADYVDSAGNMELKWFFWSGDFSKLRIDFQCIKLTLRTWTFMAYVDGDDDFLFLSGCSNYTINMMEDSSVSTSDVAVIVQSDNYTESLSDVKRYLILRDSDVHHITSPVLWSHDEVNMGDPSTLVSFVNWSMQAFPAKHYALILWDHGWGFRGLCNDSSQDDMLQMVELKQALTEIGVTFDLIGFDACFMGQLEVAYQIREYAQVVIGFEGRGDMRFLPYNVTLMDLADDPMMSAVELGQDFVTNFANYRLANFFGVTWQTIAAVSLVNITELSQRLSDLATELIQHLEAYREGINQSRELVEWYGTEMENLDYVDIYHLADLLSQNINNGTVQNLCQQIKQALNATIISEWHRTDGPYPNSHGLSIYFPDAQEDYEAQYEYTKFCNCTQWDEFLRAYLGI